VRRRDVVFFDERGVEELKELADFTRVHAAVNVLAGSRETRLEVSERWVEAVNDFLLTFWQVPVHPIFKRNFARDFAQVTSWHGLPPKSPKFRDFFSLEKGQISRKIYAKYRLRPKRMVQF